MEAIFYGSGPFANGLSSGPTGFRNGASQTEGLQSGAKSGCYQAAVSPRFFMFTLDGY